MTRLNSANYIVLCFVVLCDMSIVFAAPKVEYNRDIRPILSQACFTCHGPDAKARKAEMRLDSRDAALKETAAGNLPILPGKADASAIIQRITATDPDERMPPAEQTALTAAQIEMLTRWIDQGAEYQQHWAFLSLQPVTPPAVKDNPWIRNAVDQFVLAQLKGAGLEPNSEAGRETIIRRVAFDVTGLPPTLKELDQYLADSEPDAYERMLDHFLDSPAYGEHMARYWLDLARYADTNGYQYDTERTQWVWRDWVIHAYNANMPFDQFTVEQLAGDLIPDNTPDQQLATGFNRNHAITIEGGIISEEYRVEYVMDRLVTTGSVWLGMTVGCARCHEHKYDPLSQQEFYRMFAYFNQVPEKGNSGFDPRATIASPLATTQQQNLNDQIQQLKLELQKPRDDSAALAEWAKRLVASQTAWHVLEPKTMTSSGGSTLKRLADNSVLAGAPNPAQDIYDISATTAQQNITAVRLQCLTHDSLPGGGPGRHTNSNFVLSEFELSISAADPAAPGTSIRFIRATADYNQNGYHVKNAIDATVAGNNGWAVDGPTRKEPATAIFVAEKPFGNKAGVQLHFRLRHEAGFGTHGIGRPRLSITSDDPGTLKFQSVPEHILHIAGTDLSARSEQQTKEIREYFLAHHSPAIELKERIAALESEKTKAFPATMVMRDMAAPRKTYVLNRGQYNKPAAEVTVGVPAVFPPLDSAAPANRLGFAQWLMQPNHPLTARVAVNRYWQRLFGTGLVKTAEDFGTQGELPSHPRLLDWLALDFQANGWNIKRTLKTIIMSATYRQSSRASSQVYQQDPENRLLARGPRLRLSAEEIRDQALAISSLLVSRQGGKSVYPYQPEGIWMELNNRPGYSRKYPQATGDDLYRRSLYTFWKRTVPSPMLKTLDAPEREFCTIQRSRTNTPLQSLLLLNAPQFVEAARHLAKRIILEAGTEPGQKITYGFRLVTGRHPSRKEISVLETVFRSNYVTFTNDPDAAKRLLQVGDSVPAASLDAARHAAWTMVCRMLLNLDEAVTKD